VKVEIKENKVKIELNFLEKLLSCTFGDLEFEISKIYEQEYNKTYLIRRCGVCIPFVLKFGTYYYNKNRKFNPDVFNFLILVLLISTYFILQLKISFYLKIVLISILIILLFIFYRLLIKEAKLSFVKIINKGKLKIIETKGGKFKYIIYN